MQYNINCQEIFVEIENNENRILYEINLDSDSWIRDASRT